MYESEVYEENSVKAFGYPSKVGHSSFGRQRKIYIFRRSEQRI